MLVVVEVVVDKEVRVTPLVLLEHLKRKGYELAVAAEIVEHLSVYLRLCLRRGEKESRKSMAMAVSLLAFIILKELFVNDFAKLYKISIIITI